MTTQQAANTAWAVLPVLLVLLALRPASSRQLSAFAFRYGVDLTPETVPVLTRLVFRSRAARLIGAALGLSIVPLANAVGLSVPSDALFYGVCGYLIGAFVAALIPSWPVGRTRSASLSPRRAAQYLPRSALVTPVVAVVVSAIATLVYALEPRTTLPTYTGASSGLAITVVAVAASALAIRAVVRRPQPVLSPDLTAADDALRSQALHILAGAGLAVALLGTASALLEMGGYSQNHLVHTIGWIGALVAIFGALTAWLSRTSPWLVRRAATS